jgi:hypothetical protein
MLDFVKVLRGSVRMRAFWLCFLLLFSAQFGVSVPKVAPLRSAQVIVVVDRTVEESQETLQAAPEPTDLETAPSFIGRQPVFTPHATSFQRPPPRILPLV